ncbi:MAG: sigma-54-dependent Fis family transcriptional regulator [Deltaproteobacteria bacterium]|nr:sigma-54-dependent Fis family transcriptional regulator [Deltaproteobacteria bacterium]
MKTFAARAAESFFPIDRTKVFCEEGRDKLERGSESVTRILVVDDEQGARDSLEVLLEDHYEIECAEDGLCALSKLRQKNFDLVLLDITLPKLNGIEILKKIKELNEGIDVIMVSGLDCAHEATLSMKSGAFDYITKPYEPERILKSIERVVKKRFDEQPISYSSGETIFNFGSVAIISQSPRMYEVFQAINKVACASSNVLITGESGTGKELIARAIHAKSARAGKPFVAINCAAIPPELMESELFGHEKGAFTGAHIRNIGKFEYAHGSSIFLDEISSLRLELQAKLLRVLQEREFCRVGSHKTINADVRVIAATNTRLEDMVKEGKFRGDLYFRLNVIPINLPPLRDRKGDVSLLARHFLKKFSQLSNKKIKGITRGVLNVLESYPFPGNVRELENIIERMVVMGTEGEWIDEKDLSFDLLGGEDHILVGDETSISSDKSGLIQARQAFERQYILNALEKCRWNQTDTARLLKIHRNTLMQKMKVMNLRSQGEIQQ